MEKLQPDSTMDLAQHLRDVNTAIEQASKPDAGGNTSSAENSFVNEIISSQLPPVASMFLNVIGDVLSSSSKFHGRAPAHPLHGSLFLSGGKKSAAALTPLVPMSYGEKKEAARIAAKSAGKKSASAQPTRDIFGRAACASQSLTGATSTSQKPVPIKGMVITPEIARGLGLPVELVNELAATLTTKENPYENNPKRLLEDLLKGVETAEQFALKNPNTVALALQTAPVPKLAEATATRG